MLLHNSDKVGASSQSESPNEKLLLLSTWLEENPQIGACKDIENLRFFLKNCKQDVERTKKKLKAFYQMRAERTEWFDNRDPFLPEIQDLLSLGVFLPVDGVDSSNRKVVIIRTAAHDPKLHTQNNVFKVGKMVLDLLLKYEPDNCSNGIVAIFDMKGVQFGHALAMSPKIIKHSVDSWTAYPCQPKVLEFVNAPSYVNVVLNTFRVFMTNKMRSRVTVRKQSSSIKCEHLPKEVGGTGSTYEELSLKWKKLVEENVDFYNEYDQYKSILNKKAPAL